MKDGVKRHKHRNPTDNEDEKTKGKERERDQEIKQLVGKSSSFFSATRAWFFPLVASRRLKTE